MGNAHGVELFPDQESVGELGTKSIISASFEALNPAVTADDFVAEFITMLRYPVNPMSEAVLKKVDLDEKSADEFIVKVILDGKKLDQFGYGRGDGIDGIRVWKRVTVDRTKKILTLEDYVDETQLGAWADQGSDSEVIMKTVCYVLSGPTRCEFAVDRKGERWASDEAREFMYFWTDPLLEMIQQDKSAKVLVTGGAPSIKETGAQSNVSGPLDEYCSYDKFFEKMVDVLKEAVQRDPSSVPEDVSATEFVTKTKQVIEDKEKEVCVSVKWAQDAGSIEYTTTSDGVVQSVAKYFVHKSPFVVESWVVGIDGERAPTSDTSARALQRLLNTAIDKANSWLG